MMHRIRRLAMWMGMACLSVLIIVVIYLVVSLIPPRLIGDLTTPVGSVLRTLAAAGTICAGVAAILWCGTALVERSRRAGYG